MAIILLVSGLLLLIDQLSKYYIEKLISPAQSIPLIEDLFQLTLVHNPGGAFGLLSGVNPLFFIIISALTIMLIFFFWKKFLGKDGGGKLSLGLIIGGALGNLLDRLRFGHVIDFLHFNFRGYYWPVFNFADVGISIGIIFLSYKIFQNKHL